MTAVQKPRETLDTVVIRFAGDSGDGMQLTGNQFTMSTAMAGNDLATFPDYPAEIRAPLGTTFGVSSFQINFGSHDILTPGDDIDVLVAMNPAALKVNLDMLRAGGLILADRDSFTDRNVAKAGYESNPLEDGTVAPYKVMELEVSRLTLEAVAEVGLSKKDGLRCKNFWTLGLLLWMFDRRRAPVQEWIEKKFAKRSDLAKANVAALNAGHIYGETAELSGVTGYTVARAKVAPGTYRTITGTEGIAQGLVVGSRAAGIPLVFASYPITPASPVLHYLADLKEYGVMTFQAEDEIAAACIAIGASFAGKLGVTSSSGPGIALKGEAIGLAVSTELPLVIVNAQRAGPSTGMPTKTEQADLLQALYGRNGESPIAVIAAATPSDSFDVAIEAVRLATHYMTPVMLMTDSYLVNAAEPWLLPNVEDLPTFPVTHRTESEGFQPFQRDERGVRPWAIPGTPGLEHRIGGLEKDSDSGNISYDASNHQKMTDARASKIEAIARDIPEQAVDSGPESGNLVVVGWGSTHGSIKTAASRAREDGFEVSHIHIRYLSPMPLNLGELLGGFEHVLVAEMNTGQLLSVLRAKFLIPAVGHNRVDGQLLRVDELVDAIKKASKELL